MVARANWLAFKFSLQYQRNSYIEKKKSGNKKNDLEENIFFEQQQLPTYFQN